MLLSLSLLFLVGNIKMTTSFQKHPTGDFYKRQIENIIDHDFPELRSRNIELRIFDHEKSFFFYTFVENALSLFSPRLYIIRINRFIMDTPPPIEGLRAILAHELQHLSDYTKMTTVELGWLALQYQIRDNRSFIARFERRTDTKVVKKGFGEGLKIYRAWLYQNIPSESLATKKTNYLTPNEISAVEN